MKHLFPLSFCCLIMLLVQPSFGQVNYNQYKKHNHKWPDASPVPGIVNPVFSNEDAVIIDEHQVMSVGSSLGSLNNVMFQRNVRLKILTRKGVEQFSTIIIPESLDPLYDYHNLPFVNDRIKKGPDYFEATLNWFAARIIKPDGKIVEVPYTDTYKFNEVLSMITRQSLTYKYFKSYYWEFICSNIEPGDELEYDYQLMVPYGDNYFNFNSGRIFLHGEIPKQNYTLVFKYTKGSVNHQVNFINSADPDSSATIENTQYYFWNRNNLPGCLDEAGAQPYQSLPHIQYSLNTRAERLRYNDAVTAKFKYIPYWLAVIRLREEFDYTMRRNAAVGIKDKQNLLIDAFIKTKTDGVPDSMNFLKFTKIHRTIADSFKYANDELLFREEDNRSERLGEFTTSYKIREISRYKLYAKILNELKLDYFSFYLMDKRYGKVTETYQSPIWNAEGLYGIYYNKAIAMVHPKKSDFGWYVEELPFYWENTSGLLLNYNDLFYDLLEKPRIVNTAASTSNDNTRMCNVKAEISLDNKTVSFDAKVSLSGQYSTITRGLYTIPVTDSINNFYYTRKISSINHPVKVNTEEITGQSSSFPFKFDVRTSYTSIELVTRNADGTISIDLSGWFNHIIYENLQVTQRQLDFYPDFVGQDTYRYYLHFDKPVTYVSGIETQELNNAMGKLSIKISQPQPDGILIESYFATVNEKVVAEKITEVADLYNAISRLNTSRLLLKL